MALISNQTHESINLTAKYVAKVVGHIHNFSNHLRASINVETKVVKIMEGYIKCEVGESGIPRGLHAVSN